MTRGVRQARGGRGGGRAICRLRRRRGRKFKCILISVSVNRVQMVVCADRVFAARLKNDTFARSAARLTREKSTRRYLAPPPTRSARRLSERVARAAAAAAKRNERDNSPLAVATQF